MSKVYVESELKSSRKTDPDAWVERAIVQIMGQKYINDTWDLDKIRKENDGAVVMDFDLKINGVEVDFLKFVRLMGESLNEKAAEYAKEFVNDKFEGLEDSISDFKYLIVEKIKKDGLE